MLKPQIHREPSSIKTIFPLKKPFLYGSSPGCLAVQIRPPASRNSSRKNIGVRFFPVKAIVGVTDTITSVKAVVTVKRTMGSLLSSVLHPLDRGSDDLQDLLGKTLLLELVSAELDSGKYYFMVELIILNNFFFFSFILLLRIPHTLYNC